MATALRCLLRIPAKNVLAAPKLHPLPIFFRDVHARNSPRIQDIDVTKLPEFETSSDPNEWKYVERLMPLEIIPQPKVQEKTASGWVPQKDEAFEHPYFIRRTKNHMRPVYLKFSRRGDRQVTLIRRIDGNIWQLEQDIREFLEKKHMQKHINQKRNISTSQRFLLE